MPDSMPTTATSGSISTPFCISRCNPSARTTWTLCWPGEQIIARRIDPILLPAAQALVERHRAAGDTLLIITATNAFVTAPIAERYGIPHLIATEPEQRDGRYTGAVAGIPAFQHGKVQRLEQWLQARDEILTGSHFYSDSINDVPLLERVDHPVAVDPDPRLSALARERGWPILSLRPPQPAD